MPVSKITWRMQKAHMEKLKATARRQTKRRQRRQVFIVLGLRQHLMTAEIGVDPRYLNGVPRDARENMRKQWKADQTKWLRAHPVAA